MENLVGHTQSGRRAITHWWKERGPCPRQCTFVEGVRQFPVQDVGGADVYYIYLFILLLLYYYITFNKAVMEQGVSMI